MLDKTATKPEQLEHCAAQRLALSVLLRPKVNLKYRFVFSTDESIKAVNKGNFKLRSKSVDYKLALFDDLKSSGNCKDNQNAANIFGQSLYKTILVDANKKRKHIYIVKTNDSPQTTSVHSNLVELRRSSELFEALDLLSAQQMNNENTTNVSSSLVPNIIKQSCEFIEKYGLDVVGIFRIDSSKKRIKEVSSRCDMVVCHKVSNFLLRFSDTRSARRGKPS